MEAANIVVGKVVNILFDVAKMEISHMWNCSENVENLKYEAEKLSDMKGRVQQQIDLAKSKGEVLLEGVEGWMKKADAKISEASKFITQEGEAKKTCYDLRFCVNLGTLHHYGKMAAIKIPSLQQHLEDGKGFETLVSHPAPTPEFTDLYQRKDLENIDTHKSTLEEIIRAVEDDKIQIVGINGLGGVGKTTLASEVAMKMKNQFDCIVFIAVSQTVDSTKIKKEVEVAAKKILSREKVLIILDDVWEELNLEELGIPCVSDYMKCKILLTSRSIDVCEAMNAQKNISVNPLKEKEAWTLFERVVGKTEWDDKLKEVALKIVGECGGLPLFIQVIGKALRNKENNIWEAAIRQLQDPTDKDVPFKRKGIKKLKLSYDYLESEVAKSCFLLCSVFPEDSLISHKMLTYYGVALGIFNNLDSIQDAKARVQVAVDYLISSSLLLPMKKTVLSDSYEVEKEYFKMHDLVRDMALFITSKGKDMFLVQSGLGLTEWQPRMESIKSYRKISLMRNKIRKLPEYELDFPHLDTFLIQNNKLSVIHDEFFQGMKKLIVLDMSSNPISPLPRSLNQLIELRMLDLSGNKSLREISILGELTCLEILRLRSTRIKNIPKEIRKLTKLRLLDAWHCKYLSYVAPGVISNLIWLEVLYIELRKEVEGSCNFFVELSELKLLNVLSLSVPALPNIFYDATSKNLKEFHIMVNFTGVGVPYYERMVEISSCSFPFPTLLMKLIQVSEWLELHNINDLDNILPDLYPEGFDELKCITLKGCENVRSLVKTCDLDAIRTSNELGESETKGKIFSQVEEIELESLNMLEVLLDGSHQYISFCNLTKIYIGKCHSLLEVFPVGVMQEIVKLRDLTVSDCKSLVVVISAGSEIKQADIVFPVTCIKLLDLPKLESFYNGHSIINYPSLENMKVENCLNMKRWSNGDNHMPKLDIDLQGINDLIAIQQEMYQENHVPNIQSEDEMEQYSYPKEADDDDVVVCEMYQENHIPNIQSEDEMEQYNYLKEDDDDDDAVGCEMYQENHIPDIQSEDEMEQYSYLKEDDNDVVGCEMVGSLKIWKQSGDDTRMELQRMMRSYFYPITGMDLVPLD